MRKAELYEYHGVEYTMADLVRMSNLHRDTITRRLSMGLTVEEALDLPNEKALPMLRREDIGKKIPIVFRTHVPVFGSMQPILGKQYMATICGSANKSNLCRVFYMITLENGKKLITYPGEFEIQSDTIPQ